MASDTLQERAAVHRPEVQTIPGAEETGETPGFSLQTVGGLFDSAFDLYKSHFATLALIVACVFIPTQVILHAAGNLWLKPIMTQINSANPDPIVVLQVAGLGLLIGAPQFGVPGYLSLLTSFMASGPVAVAVANILVGRPLSVAAAYRRAVPVFWRLFGVWNLIVVLFVLTFIVVAIALMILLTLVAIALTQTLIFLKINPNIFGSPEMSVVIVILMIVLPYLTSCAFASKLFVFAPPLVGLENLTVLGAVERNSLLVSRKHFRRIFLTVTLLPIVTFSLQMLILASAASVVEALKWPAWADFVVSTGLSSLINFFFQPYWMIFITLLYFDTRVRQEGLDVRYLADNLPMLDAFLGPPGMAANASGNGSGHTPPSNLPLNNQAAQQPTAGRESL